MIEDFALLSINVRIWKRLSYLIKDGFQKYLTIIPIFLMDLFMWMDLARMDAPVDMMIVNAFFAVLYLNCLIRTVSQQMNRPRFEAFVRNTEKLYNEVMKNADAETQDMLKESTKDARRFAIWNLFLGYLVSVCFFIYPLFVPERRLPYRMYIPGLDLQVSPIYEIIFALQAILTPFGCWMYIPISNAFVSFMMFIIVMQRRLQHKLLHTQGNVQEMVWAIKYHIQIITYVKRLNELFTFICFFEFLSFGMLLCVLLFLLIIVDGLSQILMICSYITMIMTQIFTIYWYANEVYVEGRKSPFQFTMDRGFISKRKQKCL